LVDRPAGLQAPHQCHADVYKAEVSAIGEGRPLDHAAKGSLWELFGDSTLNNL
jgi:hypothetical protein